MSNLRLSIYQRLDTFLNTTGINQPKKLHNKYKYIFRFILNSLYRRRTPAIGKNNAYVHHERHIPVVDSYRLKRYFGTRESVSFLIEFSFLFLSKRGNSPSTESLSHSICSFLGDGRFKIIVRE